MGKSWKPGGVSAVLIVKNEQAHLARCLESLAGVDEIVVLDTGSSDQTVDVARSFMAKVSQCKIEPFHFAEARNQADRLATKDWILSIDADEVLLPGSMEKIQEAVRLVRELKTAVHAFRIGFGFPSPSGGETPVIPKRKLYRRGAFEWRYRVHEQLFSTIMWKHVNVPGTTLDLLDVRMDHLPAEDKASRRAQNTELLELSVQESPEYLRNVRQLGMEHYLAEDWVKAEEWLSRYVLSSMFSADPVDTSETVMRLAQAKAKQGRAGEALIDFDRAIGIAPGRREPRYMKAVCLIGQCRLDDALVELEACRAIDPASKPDYYLNLDELWTGDLIDEAESFCRKEIEEAKKRAQAG